MNFEKCSICNEYDFKETHRCKPVYYVQFEDYSGEKWCPVRANSEEMAVECYGQHYNESDYYSLMNNSIEVFVSKFPDGKDAKKYKVSAAASIEYYVSEVEGGN